ncbi:MAG: T9SS type A sorting domain-containing protein [Ferruginibacter sp.]
MNKFPFISIFLITHLYFSNSFAVNLKASYDPAHDRVDMNWVKDDKAIRQFIIQRSTDQSDWSDIAYQNVTDYNSKQTFQYFDTKPRRGKNFYRLKIINNNEAQFYSAVASITAEAFTYDWIIYPVPVGEVFSIQYKGTAPIRGVANVQIINMEGKVMTSLRFASTTTTMQIRTNNLFKGVYVLRIIVENEIIWNKQFVK